MIRARLKLAGANWLEDVRLAVRTTEADDRVDVEDILDQFLGTLVGDDIAKVAAWCPEPWWLLRRKHYVVRPFQEAGTGCATMSSWDVIIIGGGHAGCEAAAASARAVHERSCSPTSLKRWRDVLQPRDRWARQRASGSRD